MHNLVTAITTAVEYIWSLLRVDSKSSHHKQNIFFLLSQYEKMDVISTYCSDHFTIYVSQIIILYTLNSELYIIYTSTKL